MMKVVRHFKIKYLNNVNKHNIFESIQELNKDVNLIISLYNKYIQTKEFT